MHERLVDRERKPAPGAAPPRAVANVAPIAVLSAAVTSGHRLERLTDRHDAPAAGARTGHGGPIQRFPFTATSGGTPTAAPLTLVAKLEGPFINLYSHGVEVGYLRISLDGKIWELKDIIIHDEAMRGAGLGALLVYFFAELAVANGATELRVLLQNNSGLYQNTGFVVTPNAVNPNNPPTITGVAATVRNTARAVAGARFQIRAGLPAPAAPAPLPPGGRRLINDNTYGRPDIGNDDL